MLNIRPNFPLDMVIQYLDHAFSTGQLVRNEDHGNRRFANYLNWVANQQKTLGTALQPVEMDRLITTRQFWSFVAASTGAQPVILNELLTVELTARIDAIEKEAAALRQHVRSSLVHGVANVCVLDTNVLMLHHGDLAEMDWHKIGNQRPLKRVRVVIPIIVIDELDRLKRSQGTMVIDGKSVPRRTRARQALRTLSTMFEWPTEVVEQEGKTEKGYPLRVSFELLLDEPGHVRLESADAEIRDRALSLVPYASETTLVTFDLGNQMAAMATGLRVHRLLESEDEEKSE